MTRSLIGLGLLVLLSGAGNMSAQTYPDKPVRVILAQLPGSSADTILRIVTAKMSEMLGQQFIVDNRGGAGGLIGAQIGARAAPNGYQLANKGLFIQWQDGAKVVVWPDELAAAKPRLPTPRWSQR